MCRQGAGHWSRPGCVMETLWVLVRVDSHHSSVVCLHHALAANLGAAVTALDAQLVDLTLGNIGSLFSFVQLVLELTELAEVNVCLFLLFR